MSVKAGSVLTRTHGEIVLSERSRMPFHFADFIKNTQSASLIS